MASLHDWIEGARPKTLPVSVAAALGGTIVPLHSGSAVWWLAALAFVVMLGVQVGANFVNDYADGVRGTDVDRVGPMRLVASGKANPQAVRWAAVASFGVAAVAGIVIALSTFWWLIALGAVCILVAWMYTAGPFPYSYYGLGEVMVFLFFGPVAVLGTTFIQLRGFPEGTFVPALASAVGVGVLTAAVMASNNLRDIPTDREQGKKTLAVALGDTNARRLYVGLNVAAVVCLVVLAATTTWWALLGAAFLVPAVAAIGRVRRGAAGMALIPVLKLTGQSVLLWAAGAFGGTWLAVLLG